MLSVDIFIKVGKADGPDVDLLETLSNISPGRINTGIKYLLCILPFSTSTCTKYFRFALVCIILAN